MPVTSCVDRGTYDCTGVGVFTSGRRTYIGSRGSARVLNSEPVVKFAELNLKAVCLKMTRFLKNLLNKRWWVL